MRLFTSAVGLLVSAAPAFVFASDFVTEATTKNFDKLIGNTPTFVNFYAPWDTSSKNLAPFFEMLGEALAPHRGTVNLVKVDANDAGKEIGSKYGVTSFPTLKWFPKGIKSHPVTYNGDLEIDAMLKYVKQKAGLDKYEDSEIHELAGSDFDRTIADPTKNVLVTFMMPWSLHWRAMQTTYELVAKNFKDEPNCIVALIDSSDTPNKEINERYDLRTFPNVKFFPADKNKTNKGKLPEPIEYEGTRTEEALVKFLNEKCGTNKVPLGGKKHDSGEL